MIRNGYKIYIGYEFEVENNINSLIEASRSITGLETSRISDYHGLRHRTELGLWRLEKDASLCNGAEFISPPVPMEESFEMMRMFFQAITKTKSVTSKRCGCHTNVCLTYGGKILKINENAMLHNLDWRVLCSLWPHRLKKDNRYCRYLNTIFKNIRTSTTIQPITNLDHFGKAVFGCYHGFITRKSSLWNKKGMYYELRFPGGEDYHLYPEKIETTVKHFSEVLDKSRLAACKTRDKVKDRKIVSYINRIYKQPLVEIPSFNFLSNIDSDFEKINDLKIIKNIIPTEHENQLSKNLFKLIRQIIRKADFENPYLSRQFSSKLFETINKEHIVYYIIRYFVVSNYPLFTANITVFRKILDLEKVKFTIPVDEFDTDKLWIINLVSNLNNFSKDSVIKITKDSIKNIKTKTLWDKMLNKNNTISMRIKYIKAATKHHILSSGGNKHVTNKKDNNI